MIRQREQSLKPGIELTNAGIEMLNTAIDERVKSGEYSKAQIYELRCLYSKLIKIRLELEMLGELGW